ncbi:MAG: hypothetical protein HY608_04365 [Planctomycetes bacterium]|nr:hypothetical protein [Planctomycetota bacterium]
MGAKGRGGWGRRLGRAGIASVLAYGALLFFVNLALATSLGRNLVDRAVERFWPGRFRIGRISLGPLGGVRLAQVRASLAPAPEEPGQPREIVSLDRVTVWISWGELAHGRVRPVHVALRGGRIACDEAVAREVRAYREARRRRPRVEGPPETWVPLVMEARDVTFDMYGWHGERLFGRGVYQRRGVVHAVSEVRIEGPLWEDLSVEGERNAQEGSSRWEIGVKGVRGGAGLLELFPRAWQRSARDVDAHGPADVSVRIADPGGHSPVEADIRVRLQGGSVRMPYLPAPVEDLHGLLVCSREGVVSEGKIVGRLGGIPIAARIRYEASPGRLRMDLESESFAFTPDLAVLMPGATAEAWRELAPNGEGRLISLLFVHERGLERTVATGQADLSVCNIEGLSPPLRGQRATLDIVEAILEEGRWTGHGNLRVERVEADPVVVSVGEAPFLWTPELLAFGPGDDDLGRMRGHWAGGDWEGSFRIERQPAAPSRVSAYVKWYGADLTDILEEAGSDADLRGEFKGRFRMSQEVGRIETRTGGGWFTLKHGNLFHLPVLASLPTLLWGQSRADRTIGKVEGKFLCEGDRIVFARTGDLLLSSHWAAVRGKGTIWMDSRVDIHLLVNPLDAMGWCARVPLLSRICQGVEQSLFEVVGDGTWSDTRWRTGPGVLHWAQRQLLGVEERPVTEEDLEEHPREPK